MEALSLRSLAEAVGVSHAAPAHHFADKEALLDAVRTEAWRRFADALEAGGARGLKGTGEAYVGFALDHPRQVQLMFRLADHPPPPELLEQAGWAWALLAGGVERELGPAAADPSEVHAMALAAWAMVHGLATLWTEVQLPGTFPEGAQGAAVRERALDTLPAGLAHVWRT